MTEVELLREQLAAAQAQLTDWMDTAEALYKAVPIAYERGQLPENGSRKPSEMVKEYIASLQSELDEYRKNHNILHSHLKCGKCGCKAISLVSDGQWNCDGCKNRWSVNHSDDRLKRFGYMDCTAFQEELGEDSDGTAIYPTPNDVLDKVKCSSECGVCRVTVTLDYIV